MEPRVSGTIDPTHRLDCGSEPLNAWLYEIDRTVQGRRLGTYLLLDAIELVAAASGRLLIVDATDEAAAAFYRTHGFTPITATRRLYGRISSLGLMYSHKAKNLSVPPRRALSRPDLPVGTRVRPPARCRSRAGG